jgi:hypothetical protein
MARYFNLAHGTKPLESAGNFPWPYDIDVCFEPVTHPIAFSEGVGHGSAGCVVSASQALQPEWRKHFEIANGLWLVPYIENLAAGTPLPREQVLRQFEAMHGRAPESHESK